MNKTKSELEQDIEVIEDLGTRDLAELSLELKELGVDLDVDPRQESKKEKEEALSLMVPYTAMEPRELSPAQPVRSRVIPPDPVKRTKKVAWFSLLLSLVAVGISLIAYSLILAVLKENEELDTLLPPVAPAVTPQEEGNFIQYQSYQVPVLEDVPVNSYDARGFYTDNLGFVQYEMDGDRGIMGIDVSYHQQTIDWAEVAASGIEFAMIRVARRGYGEEGSLGLDTHYVENILGAMANGIHVGVYFFSQATNLWEVDEEIAMLLSLIENYDITYPVVFDWEYITTSDWARTDDVTGDEVTAMAKHFCQKIAYEGYIPAIYFNMDMGYLHYDLSELTDYSFWLAELNTRPRFYYDFDMWQYSFTGSVAGIQGDVDMNLSFRDYSLES